MFIVCLNSNWCHITQRNKESTRVWDGGEGNVCVYFSCFLLKSQVCTNSHYGFSCTKLTQKKNNKTKLNMYKVKEK